LTAAAMVVVFTTPMVENAAVKFLSLDLMKVLPNQLLSQLLSQHLSPLRPSLRNQLNQFGTQSYLGLIVRLSRLWLMLLQKNTPKVNQNLMSGICLLGLLKKLKLIAFPMRKENTLTCAMLTSS